MCGIAGVVGTLDAAGYAVVMGVELANRGRSGFGLTSVGHNGNMHSYRTLGSVTAHVRDIPVSSLPGSAAIVHTWYGTSGSQIQGNLQPFVAETKWGQIALAHNGNMERAMQIRASLIADGAYFISDSDTEVILKLLSASTMECFEDALRNALMQVGMSYCLLLLTNKGLYAVRDPSGNRPLYMLQTAQATYVASEDPAFRKFDGVKSEIQPGELVFIPSADPSKVVRSQLLPRAKKLAICSFEFVYFARPDTSISSTASYECFRIACGKRLAHYFTPNDLSRTIISAVPDSGSGAASGYASVVGTTTMSAIRRNHYTASGEILRSFIGGSTDDRVNTASNKFLINRQLIRDKDIILVDDSLVRGTTLQRPIRNLRHEGVGRVHVLIASPPVIGRCPFGISIRSVEELVAPGRTVADICTFIEADSLHYLPHEDFRMLLAEYGLPEVCDGCFTGIYPAG